MVAMDYVLWARLNHVVFVVYWDYVSSSHGCFYDNVDEGYDHGSGYDVVANSCHQHCHHHNDGCYGICRCDDICVKVIVIENGIGEVMEIVDVADPLKLKSIMDSFNVCLCTNLQILIVVHHHDNHLSQLLFDDE